MSHRAAPPLLNGQPGLCAIQCLNLALFVYAEYDRLFRGIQVQAHPIGPLFQKFRIARGVKGLVRWGCKLWARQILLTVDLLTPWFCAMVRQLQCVMPAGLVCSVASTTAAIFSIA